MRLIKNDPIIQFLDQIEILMQLAPENLSEVPENYWSLHLAIGAARSDAEGASLGASVPVGVQGAKPPEIF